MSEAAILRYPFGLFLMERVEFVILCQDELEAKIMRIVEYETIRVKETWQGKVAKAIEAKEPRPPEPEYWVRLSHAQIIAKLYKFDSSKVGAKHPLSISKGTLRKSISSLAEKGFLLSRSMPGDEFGAPQYKLNCQVIQKAMDNLTQDPFSYFYLQGAAVGDSVSSTPLQNLEGGPSKIEGGDLQNLEGGPSKIEGGDLQNLEVFKDIYRESDKNQKETQRESDASNTFADQEAANAAALTRSLLEIENLTSEEVELATRMILEQRRQQTPPALEETAASSSIESEQKETGKNDKTVTKPTRRKTASKNELTLQAMAILSAWSLIVWGTSDRETPHTKDNLAAAEELARINATEDDLRNVRGRLLSQKDGFWEARGVSLKNIANNFHLAALGPLPSSSGQTANKTDYNEVAGMTDGERENYKRQQKEKYAKMLPPGMTMEEYKALPQDERLRIAKEAKARAQGSEKQTVPA